MYSNLKVTHMSSDVAQPASVPQSFYSLAQFHHHRQKRNAELLRSRESDLFKANPVSSLDGAQFRNLLRLALNCAIALEGHVHKRKTSLELAGWLRVLDGEMTIAEFHRRYERLYRWADLAQMQIEPLLACCYMRMVQDSGRS